MTTRITLNGLTDVVRGEVITPSSPDYDEARRIWNGDIDRRPPVMVRCVDATDVATVVRFAAEQNLPIAVRGGGHNVGGHALCEDGVVVDLSRMRGVRVQADQERVDVQGGALWADVDQATQAHGQAVTGGIVSHTGVGGLTLGGGIGHLMRRCGLTIDNLMEAELVTADGATRVVNAENDPELLWGLRGGGGNFGVVVRFGLRTHAVGPTILGGMIVHPLDAAPDLLRRYRDIVADAPDPLGTIVNLRLCPPVPAIAAHLHGRPVLVMVVCWSGDIDRGRSWMRPLRGLGRPLLDTVGPMPYVDLQRMVDATVVPGNHYYWRSVDVDHLSDGVISTAVDFASSITSPLSAMPLYHLGGAAGRVPADATAFGPRPAHHLNMFAGWTPDRDDRDRHVEWVRDFSQAMAVHATGKKYVNFLSDDEGRDGVRAAYGERWHRLVELKQRTDPHNLFRHNFNIDPTADRPPS